MSASVDKVREIQGLYGPLTIAERVVQWIWYAGKFDKAQLETLAGDALEVITPGIWNQAEGPDFRSAQLKINGELHVGDVEIHFHYEDWDRHRHAENPDFDTVLLHVFVFPSQRAHRQVQKSNSFAGVHQLVLLPYLEQDIESYAEDYARELQSGNSEDWLAPLLACAPRERFAWLYALSQERWRQKYTHHTALCDQYGWSGACHRRVLEALGYRRNREGMLALADAIPAEKFLESTARELFESQKCHWKLSGLRPANHPLLRIEQYQTLLRAQPQWMEVFVSALSKLPRVSSASTTTRAFRKQCGWTAFENDLHTRVFSNAVPQSRMRTIFADALLPLYAAHIGTPDQLFPYWFHAHPGDIAEGLKKALKRCELIDSDHPIAHGMLQGILKYAYSASVL